MAAQAKAPYWDAKDSLGSYLGEIAHSHPLSSAQEVDLARRIKAGDEVARNRLVEANLRFVVSVAKEYQNRGVPLSDLISSGNMGLITAAERFDEERGFKFISYAVWWIRQSIPGRTVTHGAVAAEQDRSAVQDFEGLPQTDAGTG